MSGFAWKDQRVVILGGSSGVGFAVAESALAELPRSSAFANSAAFGVGWNGQARQPGTAAA